ncbi:hypothetical protein TWF225_000231 [Orbilia oligospora]|uniref:Uncharacterized protein n=1 Tax=Orbilia oligospora TaxID=2813651 RepID=A0A7C8U1N3_ORBOL|nr:hypothetical protein TWF751_004264 [Orbilia oligospora]KAF3195861.1 hypothetical protein TWF225_000231 [Orbilia oligospora]KAF3266441.1 hypothetical protein TWF128_010844 [Orbilia oligospora]KAF3272227.1 hypothetical protein TWF217_004026 [Orbilia oligospora]KAF3297607.1 hypothetical protein TWF132_006021 [Orbilia oligospora]
MRLINISSSELLFKQIHRSSNSMDEQHASSQTSRKKENMTRRYSHILQTVNGVSSPKKCFSCELPNANQYRRKE